MTIEDDTSALEKDAAEEKLYCIKRHYYPGSNKENEWLEDHTGMTLAEAQAHCASEDTCAAGMFFDGYYAEHA